MIFITQPRAGTSHNEILALQMAARERDWEVLSAPPGWRLDEELISSGKKGVPYGSQTFCEVIAQQMGWTLKQNSFDWLAKIPLNYLKRKVEFMTLGQAKKITERKFIKPADDKCFDAKVYEPGEFHPHEIIDNNYPVLVSEPVEFDIEYRFFTNGNIFNTWSNYLLYGEINNPKYIHLINADYDSPENFVFNLIHDVEVVPSVVDVGIIRGRGMAVIETNQAWASGIYGCDPSAVLDVLEKSCE